MCRALARCTDFCIFDLVGKLSVPERSDGPSFCSHIKDVGAKIHVPSVSEVHQFSP